MSTNLQAQTVNRRQSGGRGKKQPATRGFKVGFRITDQERRLAITRMEAVMVEAGLKTDLPKRVLSGTKRDGTTGNVKGTQTTIDRYVSAWNGLRDFAFYTKDYDSAMLVSREHCPDDPFPVSLSTSIHYMDFRCKKAGEPLLHYQTNQPVLDMYNKPMVCRGDWRSASGLATYRSAVSKVSRHYETTQGVYQEKCDACRALGIDVCRAGVGCASHPGKPHYWPRGNVTKNETFKERFDGMMDFVERTYEVRSSMSFLPDQLRIIRDSLIHQNDKFKLMYWTIMIVGIKLFGRIEEVLNLKVEDFDQGMFVVTEEDIEALVAVVNGKCDDKDVVGTLG
jgi:hypothetical protein